MDPLVDGHSHLYLLVLFRSSVWVVACFQCTHFVSALELIFISSIICITVIGRCWRHGEIETMNADCHFRDIVARLRIR